MSASMNADSDLELFREDLDAVKHDVASLIEHERRSDEHGSERRLPS
jgi:hypothetical protein